MIAALLLSLAVSASAQSTGTVSIDPTRLDGIDLTLNGFMVGRSTVTGIPGFKNGICFGDGTCQTTAGVAEVNTSSITTIATVAALTTTSDTTCLSTVTLTAAGTTRYMFGFTGVVFNGTTAGNVRWNVLIDGAFLHERVPANTYEAVTRFTNSGSEEDQNWTYVMKGTLAAGSHTFCIAPRSTGASTHLDAEAIGANTFWVVDLGR